MNKSEEITSKDTDELVQKANEPKPKKINSKRKKLIIIIVGIFILLGIAAGITIPLVLSKSSNDNDPVIPPSPYGYQEFNPYFFNPKLPSTISSSYEFLYLELNRPDNSSLSNRQLKQGQEDTNKSHYSYKPIDPKIIPDKTSNSHWSSTVYFQINMVDSHCVQIKFTTYYPKTNGPSVPRDVFERPKSKGMETLSLIGYERESEPFSFRVRNKFTGEQILTTKERKLLLSYKFSEVGFTLPTKRLFGLGQRNGQFMLKNGTYSLWAKDHQGTIPKDKAMGGTSGSHIHPFLLAQTKNKDYIGLFFVATTNQAFEILYFDDYEEVVLNYINLSQNIEIYFFKGDTAHQVLSRYQKVVGTPQLPPYYALGIFQGTQRNVQDFKQLIKDGNDLKLSIEGYQIDNYYDPGDTFNVNDTDLKDINAQLKEENKKLIISLKASYKTDPSLFAKQYADLLQCSIKSDITQDYLIGIIDGQHVNYLDCLKNYPRDQKYFLSNGLENLKSLMGSYDGIDFQQLQFANEINGEYIGNSTYCPNTSQKRFLFEIEEESIGQNETYLLNDTFPEQFRSFYYIPFIPGFADAQYLDTLTISPNVSRDKYNDYYQKEYYLHNANSHMCIKSLDSVYDDTTSENRIRSLIMSESTWSGSQSHSVALITNLMRSQEDMNATISMAIQLSMYGFSNIMIDACGTKGPFDESLCARWMQIAAFLPMARNYYSKTYWDETKQEKVENPSSEFAYFKNIENLASVASSIQMKLKYSLYVYSQMYLLQQKGGSIVRPLYFDFTSDDKLLHDMTSTFMLGDSLMVAPNLYDKQTYEIYFPKGNWVNINNLGNVIYTIQGDFFNLTSNNFYTNVYLKEGKIIPFQQNTGLYKTTSEFRKNLKTSLLINRGHMKSAEGTIYIDDGISKDSYSSNKFNHWKVSMGNKNIRFWLDEGDRDYEPEGVTQNILKEVVIADAGDLMNTSFACHIDKDFQINQLVFDLQKDINVLRLRPQDGQDLKFKDINVIKFGHLYDKDSLNVCEKQFWYNIDEATIEETNTTFKATLSRNLQYSVYPRVTFYASLESDDGTININIGNLDSQSNQQNFGKVTKNLSDFLVIERNPDEKFKFALIEEGNPNNVLYESVIDQLHASKFFSLLEAKVQFQQSNPYPFMGLGERSGSLFIPNEGVRTITVNGYEQSLKDADQKQNPNRNLQGYMPFYAYQSSSGDFIGVLDIQSSPQDFILNFKDLNDKYVKAVKAGNEFSLYFFRGKTIGRLIAKAKIFQYFPVPPLWAFGLQQASVNNTKLSLMKYDFDKYKENLMPLDAIWVDSQYMRDFKSFTLSKDYSDLPKYIQQMKEENIKFVPMINTGIGIETEGDEQQNEALEQGKLNDVFYKIKTEDNEYSNYIAEQYPGKTYIPDFTNSKTNQWWASMLVYLKQSLGLDYDGLWLDLNTPFNLCDGYCFPQQNAFPEISINNELLYVPGNRNLDTNSIGLDIYTSNLEKKQYQMLNIYSNYEVSTTKQYFDRITDKTPFIMTKTTSFITRQHGFHQIGYGYDTQKSLIEQIEQLFQQSFLVNPFTGADLAGYYQSGEYIEYETVTRWYQVGAFYPLSKTSKLPFSLDYKYKNDTTYSDLVKEAFNLKYSFIRYYYSEFQYMKYFGGSFFKPLSFDWSDDPFTYQNMTENIMLGSALKLSIGLNIDDIIKGESKQSQFPQGSWCQIYPTISSETYFDSEGYGDSSSYKELENSLEDIHIHMKAGYIIPFQNAQVEKTLNVKHLQNMTTNLYVFPTKQPTEVIRNGLKTDTIAYGQVFFNDGETERIYTSNVYIFVFDFSKDARKVIKVNFDSNKFQNTGYQEEYLENVCILGYKRQGLPENISQVRLETTLGDALKVLFEYDEDKDLLSINLNTKKYGQAILIYNILSIGIYL